MMGCGTQDTVTSLSVTYYPERWGHSPPADRAWGTPGYDVCTNPQIQVAKGILEITWERQGHNWYLGWLASGIIPNFSPPHFHKDDPGAGVIELWVRVGPMWHCLDAPLPPRGSTLCIQDLGRGRPGALSRPIRGTCAPNSPSVSSQFLDMEGTNQGPP